MAAKEYPLIPLFERFIKDSYKGKRLKSNGNRIKSQTIDNYAYVLRYLKEYEEFQESNLRIKVVNCSNKRFLVAEKNYWKKFYLNFTTFLYTQKNCFDNYVGTVIKIIRIFFNYLNRELSIPTGECYKKFYICKEVIPVVTLLPEQLQFLINNKEFEEKLTKSLQKAKDIFVFGCTVALRVSDLFAIKFCDLEYSAHNYYLPVKTIKTNTFVRVKLPEYAVAIIKKFKENSKGRKTIFPPIPATRFNNQLKAIALLAGWTADTGKKRSKRGVAVECFLSESKKQYRFCDLVSSHTMRRTAITTMLMLGMREHVVKKISGHCRLLRFCHHFLHFRYHALHHSFNARFQCYHGRRASAAASL